MRIACAVLVCLMSWSVGYAASIDKAVEHFAKGKHKAAIQEMEGYVKDHPTDPQGLFLLGYAYYKAGRMTEAMKYFNDAYLIDPEFVPQVPAREPAPPAKP